MGFIFSQKIHNYGFNTIIYLPNTCCVITIELIHKKDVRLHTILGMMVFFFGFFVFL